jgi:hypothetical protein
VNDTPIDINQLDPKYLGLGTAALNAQLPNPFLGNPNVPASLSTPATLSRARLLTPFPQYNQVNARQVTEGYSRYNAAVIEWSKRSTRGWGGRISYTYSVLKDNQVGETNFYSYTSPNLPMNNYNYLSNMPACQSGQQFTTACYNPSAEYGYGMLDVPHRVIIAPIVELPFGKGKRYGANSPVANAIIGGWTLSAAINLQSGFPLNVQQPQISTLCPSQGTCVANRPNLTGSSIANNGSYADLLASDDHRSATWINLGGFSLAPTNTFGNAPRTITDARSPAQYNTDAVFIKDIPFGGRQRAQIKIEMLNLFNRVNVRALQSANNLSNSNFGQTNIQAGFMRITQIMFRYSF